MKNNNIDGLTPEEYNEWKEILIVNPPEPYETQHYQNDMNLIRTTYFRLRTATVFAYTVCCVHVASITVQSKHKCFFI